MAAAGDARPSPTGDFCFELAAGDVLFGSLVGLDDSKVELDIPRLGRIHVAAVEPPPDLPMARRRRPDLPRAQRPGRLARAGRPEELARGIGPADDRPRGRVDPRRLRAARSRQHRVRDLLEDQARLRLRPGRRRQGRPRSSGPSGSRRGAATWSSSASSSRRPTWPSCRRSRPGPGRTHLQAYLDQEEGRILVFSPGGKQLADLKVAGNKPAALPGLYLANIRGDVRLEWLRIGRWNGEIPREARNDQARIHRADGSIVYGQLTGFKPDSKEFLLKTEKGESRIAEDQVSSVFLSLTKDEAPRMIRAVYQDGSRLSGELAKVEGGAVRLKVPGVEESLKLPIAGLRSLVVAGPRGGRGRRPRRCPGWRLEGIRLVGRLEDGREAPGVSCLVWHPAGSATASPLKPGVSGKIVYKEPPPPGRRGRPP